jgi:hypothetical protein
MHVYEVWGRCQVPAVVCSVLRYATLEGRTQNTLLLSWDQCPYCIVSIARMRVDMINEGRWVIFQDRFHN